MSGFFKKFFLIEIYNAVSVSTYSKVTHKKLYVYIYMFIKFFNIKIKFYVLCIYIHTLFHILSHSGLSQDI